MKKIKIALVFSAVMIAVLSVCSQKFYDAKGNLLVPNVANTTKTDSTYIKSLPRTITLSGLTKQDLRIFKGLMLQQLQANDAPYDADTKVIFDKIVLDLNSKPDTAKTLQIIGIPTNYIQMFADSYGFAYNNFVQSRIAVRPFIRVSASVSTVDTAFFLLSGKSQNYTFDKTILKKDIKNKI